MFKKLFKKIIFSLLTVITLLVLSELFFRILNIKPIEIKRREWGPRPVFRKLTPPLFGFVPGKTSHQVFFKKEEDYFVEDKIVTFRINSRGLRDSEFPLKKRRDTFRILGLGDSFTVGDGVELNDSYLKVLEKLLNEKYPKKYHFETINTAVPGYSTLHEFYFLKDEGLSYQPDFVILGFYLNDVLPVELPGEYYEEEDGVASLMRLHYWHRNIRPTTIYEGPFLLRLASKAFENIASYRKTKELFRVLYSKKNKRGLKQFEDSLKEIAQMTKAKNIGLLLVILPKLEMLRRYPFNNIHEFVKKISEKNQIPVLDLLPTLKKYETSSLWVHISDHHPNEFAHKIIAEAILEEIISNKLISIKD